MTSPCRAPGMSPGTSGLHGAEEPSRVPSCPTNTHRATETTAGERGEVTGRVAHTQVSGRRKDTLQSCRCFSELTGLEKTASTDVKLFRAGHICLLQCRETNPGAALGGRALNPHHLLGPPCRHQDPNSATQERKPAAGYRSWEQHYSMTNSHLHSGYLCYFPKLYFSSAWVREDSLLWIRQLPLLDIRLK